MSWNWNKLRNLTTFYLFTTPKMVMEEHSNDLGSHSLATQRGALSSIESLNP